MKTSLLVISLLLSSLCATAGAIPFSLYGGGASDIDTYPATSVFLVSDLSGRITDLNVQVELENMDYGDAFWGTIDIWLGHNDVIVPLASPDSFSFVSGSFVVVFDDAALSPLSYDFAAGENREGTFQALGSLSDFNGLNLAGAWTLGFVDNYFPGDGTDLHSWSLTGTLAG